MTSYKDTCLALSPILYTRLGETSGTTADDIGSLNGDGTYSGSYTLGVTTDIGDSDTAAQFTASGSGKVSVPHAASLNLATGTGTAWTIVFRVRVDGTPPGNFKGIMTKGGGTSGWLLYTGTAGTNIVFKCMGTQVNKTGLLVVDTWAHIAITNNGAQLEWFKDGTSQGTSAFTTAGAPSNTGALTYALGDGTNYHNITLDEVAIFDYTLTSTQISDLWATWTNSAATQIVCPVITASTTLLNSTVTPGAVSVVAPVITATETLLSPNAEVVLQLDVVNSSTTLFSPGLDHNIELSVLSVSSTVLQPLLMDNIDLTNLTTSTTLFSPGLNQDISLVTLAASSTLNDMTVVSGGGGAQIIDYQLISTTSTLFAPTTFSTINLPLITAASVLNAPALDYNVELPTVTTIETILIPSLEYLVEMQTINTSPTVIAPRVGPAPTDEAQYGIVKTSGPSVFPIGL